MESEIAKNRKNKSLKPGHVLLLFVVVLLLSSLPIVLREDTEEVETAAPQAAVIPNPIRTKLDTVTEYNMPIPGTRISMTCPEKFLYDVSAKKFTLPDTHASITIEVFDKPFAEMYAQWSNPDSFLLDSALNLNYLSQEDLVLNGSEALLVHCIHQYFGGILKKYVLLLGDENQSILVTGSVPMQMIRPFHDQVRVCIKTVVWHKEQRTRFSQRDAVPYLPEPEPPLDDDPERAEALKKRQIDLMHKMPFTITPPKIMQLARINPHQNIYTLNGAYSPGAVDQPVFIVEGNSTYETLTDQVAFARDRLKRVQLFIGQTVVKEEIPIQINGLDGYELTALARHQATKSDVFIYQVTLLGEKQSYSMQGIVRNSELAQYGNMLKEMAKSFRQTTPPDHL